MTVLTYPLDDWAPYVQEAVLKVARTWSAGVLDDVFPRALAAAGEEGVPMDLQAILAAAGIWSELVEAEVTPVIVALIAARTADVSDVRSVDLRPLAAGGSAPEDSQKLIRSAVALLKDWGVHSDDIEIVVTRQTWMDYIGDYARTSVNQVSGAPEAMYRELVGKLSAATQDGLPQFERNLIVRDYLDMGREGGFEAWNTRADMIARTETNRLINAGTFQSARMEQAAVGSQLEKSWVAGMDSRTRDEHFSADGQRVPVDGKFLIGGYEAEHPGDGNLPAHLSINCRCSMLLLEPDEDMPDESDRQTERERSDGTRHDPAEEVRRRAERGVTRDRDDEAALIAAGQERAMRTSWAGILAPLGKPSGDGRTIESDAVISFRDLPLPLMFQKEQSMGHDSSVIVGKVTEITADGSGIHASGELFDTEEATEAGELLSEEVIRPSVDLCDMVTDWRLEDADGNEVDLDEVAEFDPSWREVMYVKEATVMGATLVAKPAFREAKINLGDEIEAEEPVEAEVAALTAAAGVLVQHPAAAFADPELSGPTPLTVTDGRVFGHLATWGTDHVGFPGQNITPPKSQTGYAMFHMSQLDTEEGTVSVGRLTVGTGHAGARDGVHAAAEHYDSTGTTWAFVRAGEDEFGIWVAGVVNPDAEPKQVRSGASAPLSGDWRPVGGNLELVAALSVNTPGFPVPRSFQATDGEVWSLVAAAVVPKKVTRFNEMAEAVRRGMSLHAEDQREQERAAERAAASRRMAASLMASKVGGR